MIRHLMWQLRMRAPQKYKLTEQKVLEELEYVQASMIRYGYTESYYMLPSAPSETQKIIYKALALTLPTHFHEFPEYKAAEKPQNNCNAGT